MTASADDAGVRVEVEARASTAEIQAVYQVLDEFGSTLSRSAVFDPGPRGGVSEVPIVIQVLVALGLSEFYKGFLGDAGKDAYQGLRRFMGRLRSKREGRLFEVWISDQHAGFRAHGQGRQPTGGVRRIG